VVNGTDCFVIKQGSQLKMVDRLLLKDPLRTRAGNSEHKQLVNICISRDFLSCQCWLYFTRYLGRQLDPVSHSRFAKVLLN